MTTRNAHSDDDVCRRDDQAFAFSDGAGVEERLLEVISNAERLDIFAPELRRAIVDWPSEYHLSPARHCLLRPLDFRPGARVLEIGCGCGALTRFLGESGAQVLGVEGSAARARIAAARCRDLPNVEVLCADLLRFETKLTFDWIILVGVIEYAPLFSVAEQPIEHYVKNAMRFMAPGGRMVIAVENQLGLKYFNGCSEDHVGVPFFGIEGQYGRRTPVTYGRMELERRLNSCGLAGFEWYYPFPDYKLPSVILAADAFKVTHFNVPDLLVRAQSRDYGQQHARLFEESLAYAVLDRNGLIESLSNSFMLVGHLGADTARDTNGRTGHEPMAWSFAVHRHEEFATQTTFTREGERILVVKTPLSFARERCSDAGSRGSVRHERATSVYRAGRLSIWRVVEASARNASSEEVADAFMPWFDELLRRASVPLTSQTRCSGASNRLADYQIDGGLIDLTPFNMLEQDDGLAIIDQEWRWPTKIAVGQIVCRGVLHSLALPLARTHAYELPAIVRLLCARRGLAVETEEIVAWLNHENEFLAAVGSPMPRFATAAECRSHLFALYPELVRRINEVSLLQAEAARVQVSHATQRAVLDRRRAQSEIERGELLVTVREGSERIATMQQVCASQTNVICELLRDLSEQAEALKAAGIRAEDAIRACGAAAARADLLAHQVMAGSDDLDRMGRNCDAMRGTINALEEGHKRMLASTSWRLTSPLRLLKTQMRAVRAWTRLPTRRGPACSREERREGLVPASRQ